MRFDLACALLRGREQLFAAAAASSPATSAAPTARITDLGELRGFLSGGLA